MAFNCTFEFNFILISNPIFGWAPQMICISLAQVAFIITRTTPNAVAVGDDPPASVTCTIVLCAVRNVTVETLDLSTLPTSTTVLPTKLDIISFTRGGWAVVFTGVVLTPL